MTVRQTARVGCDEGKASAPDRRAGGGMSGGVPARGSTPPAGNDERAAASPRAPQGGRGRLADVGGHSTSAGPDGAAAHAGAGVRAWTAQTAARSRSRAIRASSERRRATSAPLPAPGVADMATSTGTGQSPGGDRPAVTTGVARPGVMRRGSGKEGSSRRRHWGAVDDARRRDARPARSGGRRGRAVESGMALPRQACLANETAVTAPPDQRSMLAATRSEGFRFPPLIFVRYGREIPICEAATSSVSLIESMNRAKGVTPFLCLCGTFRVKQNVSGRTYAGDQGHWTIAT